MDFAFTAEQEALRAAARDWLAERVPPSRVAAVADGPTGTDPALWPELAALGWLDAELGPLEHAVLHEQAGYALLPAPFFTTVALARAAGLRTDRPATLARGGTVELVAGRLSGRVALVPDLAAAEEVAVVAGGAVHAVRVRDAVVVPRSTVDGTRRYADLVLDGTGARRLGEVDLPAVRRSARAAAACEAVGVAQRCLDLAVAHARARRQFGRPVGSFQAVSHRLADGYVDLQLARSLAYWAAWAVDAGDPVADTAAVAAKAAAGSAAVRVAESAIQVSGGQGFTWESPLHRLYKRAQWLEAFWGTSRAHRAALADRLFGSAAG